MTFETISLIVDIVGAIAVIASLIYVGMQLKQNTVALHGQSRHAVLEAAQAELFSIVENPEIILALLKKGDLTELENIKVTHWLSAAMRTRMFAWLQYRNGIVDDEQWATELLLIQALLRAPRARHWWNSVGRVLFSESFMRVVDGAVQDQPVSDEINELSVNWANLVRFEADA